MTTENIIWFIPLPPLLAFFLIVLFTNRSKALSHTLAIGAALLSFVASMVVIWRALRVENLGENPLISSINWLPTGETWFSIGVLVDPLTTVTLFFVAWTILMIFLYSVGYHNFGQPAGEKDKPGLPPQGATLQTNASNSGNHETTNEKTHSKRVPSVEPMY
ncbi:MAG: hypothetical protein IBX69_13980, partial [Anaerolineales bacterium]|nr:hypothetical protein [Anaerolineales bacterium]